MKILHCVESYFPAPGGMQEVVKQLSERLAALGHEVTVATRVHPDRTTQVLNGVSIVDFDLAGNDVNGIEGNSEAYTAFLLGSDFQIVTFFAAQQWATDLGLPLLQRIRGKKVFVPTGFPGLFWKQYSAYFSEMGSHMPHFDMNVFLSNDYQDINFARRLGIKNFRIITNGADEREFLKEKYPDVRKELGIGNSSLVLHVGSFTGFKGQLEAMDIFLRSGIGDAVLLMIGSGHEHFRIPRRRPGLLLRKVWSRIQGGKKVITGQFSREFTVAAYKAADVFLFPSNIECSPIVLFECAAAGLPFLATDAGNAREIAEWTGGGEIIATRVDSKRFSHADINDGALKLQALLKDTGKRQRMSEKSLEEWKKKFTWNEIARQYERLYSELLRK